MIDLSLLNVISPIAEKLQALLLRRESETRIRFEKHYQPLFDELQRIHSDYTQIFHRVRERLLDARFKPHEANNILAEVQQSLSEQRIAFEAKRVLVRKAAEALLKTTLTAEEKRFLLSLAAYLLEYGNSDLIDSEIEVNVNQFVSDGDRGSTASSHILDLMSAGESATELHEAVEQCMRWQSRYLSDVSNSFIQLKLRVY